MKIECTANIDVKPRSIGYQVGQMRGEESYDFWRGFLSGVCNDDLGGSYFSPDGAEERAVDRWAEGVVSRWEDGQVCVFDMLYAALKHQQVEKLRNAQVVTLQTQTDP